jgi:hypothetical protein
MAAATRSLVDELHANSEIKEVQLSQLQSDFSYQRDTNEALVDAIANDWDTVASELILVSNRGVRSKDGEIKGGLFIVNGQHRTKAAQKRSMTTIWARVIDLRKVKDPGAMEAGFRLKTNKRISDRPLERFKAQVRSGDEDSLAIVKLLAGFDTEINASPSSEVGINCVSTVEGLYALDNGSLLSDTLEVVRDTWRHVGGDFTKASLLKGVCWFIEKHAEESDRTRLVSKLQGVGITALESRARTIGLTMGGSMWMNYYRAIVDLYNEQLREKNRLQWMLRGSQRVDRGGGQQRAA